jgi:SulP family sulfate permease
MQITKKHAMKIFPFLRWFPLSSRVFRADLIAGTTVALVLIPQSMAYAQLAGLPAYFGLYAAFLPVIFAALWGSSNQLTTGPAAMTSLLTAAMLAPFAVEGSDKFIELAILLALLAGIIRFLLGIFRMGIIVNFISHPIILGFTNAAAIIIGLSQLHKLLGVTRVRNGHFLSDILDVVRQIGQTHFPTLIMGLFALGIILLMRKYKPHLPGVLIAMPATIVISWLIGFENKQTIPIDQIADVEIRQHVETYLAHKQQIVDLRIEMTVKYSHLNGLNLKTAKDKKTLREIYERRSLEMEIQEVEEKNKALFYDILGKKVRQPALQQPEMRGADSEAWKIAAITNDRQVVLSRGGEVVGVIPAGLPEISAPEVNLDNVLQLAVSAFILALIGFVETISIAKAIATKTRQRFDVNQEMIGVGIANIAGSFASSYPVDGSFGRSALNLSMGARTGLSSVIAGISVMLVLLFFTPALYHLPQSVLAAVIMNAVIGLVNFRPIIKMRNVKPMDAITAVVTFFVTLIFAPELEIGIYIGAGLAMIFYLVRRTKPRAALLGRHWDGTLREARIYNLPTCRCIAVFRFDGSLDYPDVSYFENMVMDIVATEPRTKFIHVVADGINFIDATGLEMLRNVYRQLQEMEVQMVFSGLKRQVLEVLAVDGFLKKIGRKNIFRTEEEALETSISQIDDPAFDPQRCPLRRKDAKLLLEKKKQVDFKLGEEAVLQ